MRNKSATQVRHQFPLISLNNCAMRSDIFPVLAALVADDHHVMDEKHWVTHEGCRTDITKT